MLLCAVYFHSDFKGWTPVHAACQTALNRSSYDTIADKTSILRLLLDHKATVNDFSHSHDNFDNNCTQAGVEKWRSQRSVTGERGGVGLIGSDEPGLVAASKSGNVEQIRVCLCPILPKFILFLLLQWCTF